MAKRRRKRIASRGSVNNTILKTLINGDKYGYEIIKEVEDYSDGKIKLKQPSLYSSLSRFEEKGIVTSYWGDSDIGGRRHYYHLTEEGVKYYEKEVLKLDKDSDEEDEDDTISEMTDETIENDEEVTLTEMEEEEIPAIVDFPEKKEEVIIPDHHFYKSTPIDEDKENPDDFKEQYVPRKESSNFSSTPITISAEIEQPKKELIVEEVTEEKEEPWESLASSVKANNAKASRLPIKKLHYNRPPNTKRTKIVLDRDGIYKLRDSDYDPNTHTDEVKPVIIDNVIKRINPNNIYGYTAYTEQNKKESEPSKSPIVEISDEERKARNDNFVEKFNSISQSRKQYNKDEEISKTYLQKLDLLKTNSEINNSTPPVSTSPNENITRGPIITRSILDEEDEEEEEEYYEEVNETPNRLFDYDDVEDEEEDAIVDLGEEEEDNDTSQVNLEPENFETRNDNKQYIEEINNYSTRTDNLKMNRYENKPTAILSDKTYVLINKVKCIFGIILALIMSAELTATLFILKGKGLIIDNDMTLFIIGYSIIGVLALAYILPVMFNANEHKLNNFKTRYSIIFGILTFLISIILIYCINSLLGFKLDNFEYFATKLIVPCVMVFNFVILPPIYGLLIKSKRFYD